MSVTHLINRAIDDAGRFYERERQRAEREYFEGLYGKRPTKKIPYAKRLAERLAAKHK
jgi:hypothetical protein